MTRKDYVAIAEHVRYALDGCESPAARRQVLVVAQGIAQYAQSDNPRFDRRRFLTACGVEA